MYIYQTPPQFGGDKPKIRYGDIIFGRGKRGSVNLQNIDELMKKMKDGHHQFRVVLVTGMVEEIALRYLRFQ